MKTNLLQLFRKQPPTSLQVLLAACQPNPAVLAVLADQPDLIVREAFSTRGVIQALPGAQLVILDALLPQADTPDDVLRRALEGSGVPVASPGNFLANPEEWLGRARLAGALRVSFLPTRQVNLINWAGGVGKTTLAMAIGKRFVQRTGLPAALLELSLGGSALHARISPDLPEFFALATHKAEPAHWHGVNLYPMDGRSLSVLWAEDPDGVRTMLAEIRRQHTLLVVDAFPGHPLYPDLVQSQPGVINLIVTSPRDDALMQARRLMAESPEPSHLVLNMARSVADRAEADVSVVLPHKESWAQAADSRLADPLLALIYSGWKANRTG